MSRKNNISRRDFMKLSSGAIVGGTLSTLGQPVFAEESSSVKAVANSSKLLSRSDVLNIARNHIATFIADDDDMARSSLLCGSDFVSLFDFDDQVLAYAVPLIESGKEAGFATVSAVTDGYSCYHTVFDAAALNVLRKVSQNDGCTLRFIPPMTYIVESAGAEKIGYEQIIFGEPITMRSISGNTETAQSFIRDVRLKANNQAKNSANVEVQPRAYAEAYALKRYFVNRFVPVFDNKGNDNASDDVIHYGGNQSWYGAGSVAEDNGCGPTAAANITYYLDKQSLLAKTGLYPYTNINKSTFVSHMTTMYSYCAPSIIGDFNLAEWVMDVADYAADRGVYVNYHTCNASASELVFRQIVKEGLEKDSPVATLNLSYGWTVNGSTLGWHWMTISRFMRRYSDVRQVKVSTWGRAMYIDFDVLCLQTKNSGGGLCYFD